MRAGRRRTLLPVAALLAAMTGAGCATPGQVRLVETEVRNMRIETARRDSVRAAALVAVLALQQRIMDSLAASRAALGALDLRLQGEITDIQRQLLQVQELTGQSQQRLSQLKAQIDARDEQAEAAGARPPAAAPGDTAARAAAPAATPVATADQMYQGARAQLLRGALSTARSGFQELVRAYPTHPLVPDALFGIGQTFEGSTADSVTFYYNAVVSRFPRSARAPTALYRLGKLEEDRKNVAAARAYYDRVIKEYPASDDADLAREKLKTLRP